MHAYHTFTVVVEPIFKRKKITKANAHVSVGLTLAEDELQAKCKHIVHAEEHGNLPPNFGTGIEIHAIPISDEWLKNFITICDEVLENKRRTTTGSK